MLKKLASTLVLTTLFFSATSQALPIVQADAFTAGDNKAALETATGLVWMDFGVNSHRTFSDVSSSLDTDYAGWRLPTIAEVDHLWTSLMGDLVGWNRWDPKFGMFTLVENDANGLPITEYDDYLTSIMDIFGISAEGAAEYSEYNEQGPIRTVTYTYQASFAVFSDSGVNGFVNLLVPSGNIATRHTTFSYDDGIPFLQDISLLQGTLLVKKSTDVPEPASGLLVILAFFMLYIRRFNART
ncbi:MAG TPA: hypothetical protein VIM59_13645 [Cellvibrio sp.]